MPALIIEPIEPRGVDKETLSAFATSLEGLLKELTSGSARNHYFSRLPPGLRESMRRAWTETGPRFEELQAAIKAAELGVLKKHGLTGLELGFKIDAINYLINKFNKAWLKFWGVGWLKKLLECMDTVLKSLAEAVHAGGAINELKEILEKLLDD
jgi:hypothetical protein